GVAVGAPGGRRGGGGESGGAPGGASPGGGGVRDGQGRRQELKDGAVGVAPAVADPVRKDVPAVTEAADGLVARKRALADGEVAAVLVVEGAAHAKTLEAGPVRCTRAPHGQVGGEGTVIDAGGALVLDRGADAVARGP